MNPDLRHLLCVRNSLILPVGDFPPRSALGNGWFDLIDTLAERLQFWTDRRGAPQAVAEPSQGEFRGTSV